MKPRRSRSDLNQIDEIHELISREQQLEGDDSAYLERMTLQFEKWRSIHKFVHGHGFDVSRHRLRSDQWRAAAAHIRDLGEMELLDWVLLQAEVADNLHNGIQDMRPRKNGPCHHVMLEYVANRKRHARAVLQFAEEGSQSGLYTVNSSWHARTRRILGTQPSHDERTSGGHEGIPWDVPENLESSKG